jgi:predicted histone-like DNA-binding protein
MSVRFSLFDTPNPTGDKEKQLRHARLLASGTKTTANLCDAIAESCSLSAIEVRRVLDSLADHVALYLEDGHPVEVEGIGFFSVSLRSIGRSDEEGKKHLYVTINGVNYRCAVPLKKRLKKVKLEHVKREKRASYSREERKGRILSYVRENLNITGTKSMELNQCAKNRTISDLNELIAEGKLLRIGGGRNVMYILPYQQKK